MWLYALGVLLLLAVMFFGDTGKGAQRWLDVGFMRFQPSELIKIWLPMMMAWYYAKRPLPPSLKDIFVGFAIIAVPAALIIKQPDLGTAILVIGAGLFVIFLAGIRFSCSGGVCRISDGGGAGTLVLFTRLSARANSDPAESGTRSAGCGLSYYPVQNCDRVGWFIRTRLV